MGGSGGKSTSQAGNNSNFNQDVWGKQGKNLGKMYRQAGKLFGNLNSQMQNQVPGATNQMQNISGSANPAWQQQLQGGAYQGMDLQGMYDQALQGGGNEQFMNEQIMGGEGNNYVDAMKAQMASDSQTNLGSSLAMNDARAAGMGQSGSSRHGLTESRLYEDSNDALTDAQTKLGYDTFAQDQARKMSIAQNADQWDANKLNNVSGMLGSQNQAMQGGLNFGQGMQNLNMGQFAPSMAPWQAMGQYSNVLGNPTVLGSGKGSGSSDAKGKAGSGGMMG